ncbi:MAG: beta-ketoacyl synthase N-terminal-like domain-containing protein [Candidatus Omnitrophica bacterium]|nr:beta-ketoacyl synthase N-terminal-like domain-containing protein [Candidatus Omnitrophota bacterium]
MAKERVVITGLGVIASNGVGKDAFFEAILHNTSGIKPISLFDTAQFNVKTAGEIKDFVPEEFLGAKGLRTLDRSTKLVCSASKLALLDASLEVTEENTHDIGVSIGNTLGSVHSITEFDREAIEEGPRYVNPAFFPNTVINSPASQVSIKFNIQGFNTTISSGFSASLDALNYAADFIRLGRVKAVLAGGVEELCIQTFLGFYRKGLMAGSSSGKGGVIIGEGAAILVLEGLDSALGRKAHIYAEVLGYGSGRGSKEGINKAIEEAIKEANISSDDIDYISSGVNSNNENDLAEAEVLKDLFRNKNKLPVNPIKALVGECYSASGSLQAAASLAAIEKQDAGNVLINAFGLNGSNSSLIISAFKG